MHCPRICGCIPARCEHADPHLACPAAGRRNVGRLQSVSIAKLIRESDPRKTTQMMNRSGRVDQGFVDINAMALNAAVSGSISPDSDACRVMKIALPIARRAIHDEE